ncbi:hypothetical protein HN446_03150 [bacterium]|jgi:hypothetical protein|nr:hypothetical protein [bacterium]
MFNKKNNNNVLFVFLTISLLLPFYTLTKTNNKILFDHITEHLTTIPKQTSQSVKIYKQADSLSHNSSAQETILSIQCISEICMEESEPSDNTDECIFLFAAKACCLQNKLLILELFKILRVINHSIEYWKNKQEHYVKHFIERGPYQWLFGKKQNQDLKEKLDSLVFMQSEITRYIGTIKKIVEQTSRAYSLQSLMSTTARITSETERFLSRDQRLPKNEHDTVATNKYQLNQLTENLRGIKTYVVQMQKNVSSLTAPGHLRRNWAIYTAGAVGTFATACLLAKYSEKVPGILQAAKETIEDVYTFAIKNRLRGIQRTIGQWQRLRGPGHSNITDRIDEMREEFTREYRFQQEHLEQIARGEGGGVLPGTIEAHGKADWVPFSDISIGIPVPQQFQMGAQRLIADLYNTRLNVADVAKESAIKLEEMLNTSRDTLDVVQFAADSCVLVATTALATFGSVWAAKKLYRKINPANQLIEETKLTLKKITEILNQNYRDKKAPSLEQEGMLEFLFDQLYSQAQQFPGGTKDIFILDIELISSSSLDLEEKLRRISDMYNKYTFLQLT